MKKTSLVVGILVVIVAVVIIVVVVNNNKSSNSTTSSSTSSNTANSNTNNAVNPAATITYSDSGFSPATTTVKSGDTVAIKNTSGSEMQFDSNPHPVHTDDTDLNVGTVGPGETKTFSVTNKGTFGFHNHLNASQTAQITVE